MDVVEELVSPGSTLRANPLFIKNCRRRGLAGRGVFLDIVVFFENKSISQMS